MAFRVKTFLEITADMVARMRATTRRITDYNVGSANRSMLEAAGGEVDELYQAYAQGLIEGIPLAIYRSFDFELRPATAASGMVRFFAAPGYDSVVRIPPGFTVAAGGLQFRTAAAAEIPVGQASVDVLVICATDGTAGNVAAGAIVSAVSSAAGLASVNNPAAFLNGRGIETEAERKLRFQQFVRALARGTAESCVYAAKAATVVDPLRGVASERVARAEKEEVPGHTVIWIHNGAGGTSDALLARARDLVWGGWTNPATGQPEPGYAPAGRRVDVEKMTEIPVHATIRVQAAGTARTDALKARCIAAAGGAIRGVRSGSTLLPVELVNAVLALRAPVTGAEVGAPLLAVPCPLSAVLVPGTIAIEWI
jgi:uncharacterized phage protein gp47/JayE